MLKKLHINCGWEHRCKHKKCLECPRKMKMHLSLTLAEQIAIEDFAVCDLQAMIDEKPEQIELLQKIMRKLMKKVYK